MSAVRNMQISLGLPDPRDSSSLPVLKRVQAGIKRLRMTRGVPARLRLPITAPILEQMRVTLDRSSHPHKIALWSIACMDFFGFFRLVELLPELERAFNPATLLSWGDVAVMARPTQAW